MLGGLLRGCRGPGCCRVGFIVGPQPAHTRMTRERSYRSCGDRTPELSCLHNPAELPVQKSAGCADVEVHGVLPLDPIPGSLTTWKISREGERPRHQVAVARILLLQEVQGRSRDLLVGAVPLLASTRSGRPSAADSDIRRCLSRRDRGRVHCTNSGSRDGAASLERALALPVLMVLLCSRRRWPGPPEPGTPRHGNAGCPWSAQVRAPRSRGRRPPSLEKERYSQYSTPDRPSCLAAHCSSGIETCRDAPAKAVRWCSVPAETPENRAGPRCAITARHAVRADR